ncbi:MAG: DUF302 domain-containing protein [Terriglobales bacterium]
MDPLIIYSVEGKDFAALEADLEAAVQRHRLGMFRSLDLRQALQQFGLAFGWDCRVYDLCPPGALAEALARHSAAASVLPCRVCLYYRDGVLQMAMARTTALLGLLAGGELQTLAEAMDRELTAVLDEAAA